MWLEKLCLAKIWQGNEPARVSCTISFCRIRPLISLLSIILSLRPTRASRYTPSNIHLASSSLPSLYYHYAMVSSIRFTRHAWLSSGGSADSTLSKFKQPVGFWSSMSLAVSAITCRWPTRLQVLFLSDEWGSVSSLKCCLIQGLLVCWKPKGHTTSKS